jgi:hypothetical protein
MSVGALHGRAGPGPPEREHRQAPHNLMSWAWGARGGGGEARGLLGGRDASECSTWAAG